MFTPNGPVVGSFQHTLWPRDRASKVAILVSRAFAFVFSKYKLTIALSLYFTLWALQYTVHISIIAAKIVSIEFFRELQYFGPDLRLVQTKTAIPVRSVQNADCRLQTAAGYKMQTADWVQNADWEFILFFRLISDNMSTYRESRNRSSAIIFRDYLHYRGIFLARFLITIVLNMASSLHIVFLFCARVGWWDASTESTNLIKVDVDGDVKEMSLLNIYHVQTINSFARGPNVSSF